MCIIDNIDLGGIHESVFLCVYSFNDVASLGPSILSAKLLSQVKLITVVVCILTYVFPHTLDSDSGAAIHGRQEHQT